MSAMSMSPTVTFKMMNRGKRMQSPYACLFGLLVLSQNPSIHLFMCVKIMKSLTVVQSLHMIAKKKKSVNELIGNYQYSKCRDFCISLQFFNTRKMKTS